MAFTSFLLSVSLALFPIAQSLVTPAPVTVPLPTPTISPTPEPLDRELLKDQLQFLKDANTGLNTSFANYVNAINVSFVVLAAIVTVVGILGGVAAYIFGQNLRKIRESVKKLVEQEVERLVAVTVEAQVRDRVDNLKRGLDREKIISTVSVDYVLPESDRGEPEEYQLLLSRGFKSVNLYHQGSRYKLTAGVVVLDLITVPVREETAIAEAMQTTFERLTAQAILVIYFRGRSGAIDEFGNRVRYYAVANTPVNLMGVVVDAAAVAYAWQRTTE